MILSTFFYQHATDFQKGQELSTHLKGYKLLYFIVLEYNEITLVTIITISTASGGYRDFEKRKKWSY